MSVSGSFIATLGTKPQVVTTALDLLLDRGVSLNDVYLLYTIDAAGLVQAGLELLVSEFRRYRPYRRLSLHLRPLKSHGQALSEIDTEEEARVAFQAIYRTMLEVKRAEQQVHLSIVGGRKVLALYGMAAAQLLFEDDDRLWYVLAGAAVQESDRLHPAPSDVVRLIHVPVLRWSTISPALIGFREIEDPFEAVERQEELRLQQVLEEARSFVLGVMTARERDVVALLVRKGLTNVEIGRRLDLSPRTVEGYLGEICSKAAVHWGLGNVSRTQLVALLNFYFTVNPPKIRDIPADNDPS
jgi:CRISPR-associated protein Csx14